MKQQANHFLSFGILAAAVMAACLGMFVPTSAAQTSGKSGAEKVGETKPGAAAKTGDKAGAKANDKTVTKPPAALPKVESPPAAKEATKSKTEVVAPPPVSDPEKVSPKVVIEKTSPEVVLPILIESKPESAALQSTAAPSKRKQGLMAGLTIFVLAIFVGFDVINRVPATLHTPLMSGSNAISGITVVGAVIAAGRGFQFASFLGFFAISLAMINVVGGFLVTHRMLLMFKRK
jgi:NAD(P) transhydrogenase subunit alpha